MVAELIRRRLLVTAATVAAAVVVGLPSFRPVAGGPTGAAVGSTFALVVFVLLAGAPRVPRDRRGLPLRVAYLTAGATVEELLWRGLALAALLPRVGTAAALAVTSVGFGLVHARVVGRHCVVHLLTGAGFGLAFLIGGLPAAVIAHAGYNVLVDLGARAERERNSGARA